MPELVRQELSFLDADRTYTLVVTKSLKKFFRQFILMLMNQITNRIINLETRTSIISKKTKSHKK